MTSDTGSVGHVWPMLPASEVSVLVGLIDLLVLERKNGRQTRFFRDISVWKCGRNDTHE